MELKYTDEQTKELIDNYKLLTPEQHDEREDFILKFMAKHDKSKKSIIAKLSKSGVYITRPRISKVTGEKPETKEQMLQSLAFKLGLNIEELDGIDKSPKLSLKRLLERIEELTSETK